MTVRNGFYMNGLPDDEPDGCICGIIAGCCKAYPNCPGNPDWKDDKIAPIIEIPPDGNDIKS